MARRHIHIFPLGWVLIVVSLLTIIALLVLSAYVFSGRWESIAWNDVTGFPMIPTIARSAYLEKCDTAHARMMTSTPIPTTIPSERRSQL